MDEENSTYRQRGQVYKRIASAISDPITLEPLIAKSDLVINQGYPDGKPRARTLSTKTGKFYITQNGLIQFGISIPRQPKLPDNENAVLEVVYTNPPDDKKLTLSSSTDDTPHGNGIKNTATLNASGKSVNLTNRDLKYHEWTFAIEDLISNDGGN